MEAIGEYGKMAENKWDSFGEQIKNTVDQAIREKDFSNLSRSIGDIINDTVDTVRESARSKWSEQAWGPHPGRRPDREADNRNYGTGNTEPVLYQRVPRGKVSGILMAAGGYTGAVLFGICLLIFLILGLSGFGYIMTAGIIIFGILTAAFLILGIGGSRKLGFVRRFRDYVRLMDHQLYISVRMLAEKTGKSVSYVTADLKKMIDRRLFLQAHMDDENQCLILSDRAYRDYVAARADYQAREKAAGEARREKEQLPPECRKLIEDGEAYIAHIHWCNEQIPGEEISAKLDQMENVVTRIFAVVRERPSVAPELEKLMSYYLPTTRKLLDTYQELEHQPAAGENILSTRREIEAAIDTLNTAFEKLLDGLYEDRAWDIASDISVLNTVLAQDGLKEDGLKSRKESSTNGE